MGKWRDFVGERTFGDPGRGLGQLSFYVPFCSQITILLQWNTGGVHIKLGFIFLTIEWAKWFKTGEEW